MNSWKKTCRVFYIIYFQEVSDCKDSLLISKFLTDDSETARRITNKFNGFIFTVETSDSIVILTFVSCLPSAKIEQRGYGFRAIATKQGIFCHRSNEIKHPVNYEFKIMVKKLNKENLRKMLKSLQNIVRRYYYGNINNMFQKFPHVFH